MTQDKLTLKDFIRIILVIPLVFISIFLGITSVQLLFDARNVDLILLLSMLVSFIVFLGTTYLFIRLGNDSNYLKVVKTNRKFILILTYSIMGFGFLYFSLGSRMVVNHFILASLIFIDVFFMLKSSKKNLR